jgi:hypothetical protein
MKTCRIRRSQPSDWDFVSMLRGHVTNPWLSTGVIELVFAFGVLMPVYSVPGLVGVEWNEDVAWCYMALASIDGK